MTWKLAEVVLYPHHKAPPRRIDFPGDSLQIVTGKQRKGKSALLDIVDYCLLSSTCQIPKGVIRRTATAVGVVLRRQNRRFALVRWLPQPSELSSKELWLDIAPDASIPDVLPKPNWSFDPARNELSGFTEIESVPVLSSEDGFDIETRKPANIRHCAPFLFQHQDVIASRNVVFGGLENSWRRRHVTDALDYFLGVLNIQRLAKRRRLNELQQQLRAENRRLGELSKTSAHGLERGKSLWDAARSLGLIYGDMPGSISELAAGLQQASRQVDKRPSEDYPEQVQRLEEMERVLLEEGEDLRKELSTIEKFVALSASGRQLAVSQARRVGMQSLMPGVKSNVCPVCQGDLPVETWEREMRAALEFLEAEAEPNPKLQSDLSNRAYDIRRELQKNRGRVRSVRRRLENLRSSLVEQATLSESARIQARLIGRIDEYLKAMSTSFLEFEGSTNKLEQEIQELERDVGDRALREARRGVEVKLTAQVSRFAKYLEVEFASKPTRLNISDLSIEVNFSNRWVDLSQLGSGANRVSYHLAAVLGLHQMFEKLRSPVPRLLMLDQPSQAWFPAEDRPEDEQEVIRSVYEVLANFANMHGVQVIVVDHARLSADWFEQAIVQDWHGDEALVPTSWILAAREREREAAELSDKGTD